MEIMYITSIMNHKKGLELYSAKIDGSKNKLLKREAISPYSVSGNTIYYSGWAKEHNIHSMDISGANDKVIYNGNCTSVIKSGDYIYFLNRIKTIICAVSDLMVVLPKL